MMSNSEILFGGDPNARLDTGMTVREAIQQAESWWQRVGRRQIIELKEAQEKEGKQTFTSINPDNSNFLPSGVMNGLEWSTLTKREKLSVIKVWHHFHVRMQDVIGSDKHQYEFGNRHTIQ